MWKASVKCTLNMSEVVPRAEVSNEVACCPGLFETTNVD